MHSRATFNSNVLRPGLITDLPGAYIAEVIVSNGELTSAPARVSLSAGNLAPVAEAGRNGSVPVGSDVQLTLYGTNGVDGGSLLAGWSPIAGPRASISELIEGPGGHPRPIADEPGTDVLQLQVRDDMAPTTFGPVVISTGHRPPVATATGREVPLAGR